jgi:hypothetical protein
MVKYLHFRGGFIMSAQPEAVNEKMARMREARKNVSPMKGKYHTAETRAKISAASKGHQYNTPEVRAKISAANKGKVRSEEARAKISRAKTGTTLPDEVKAKIAESTKSDEHKAAISEKAAKRASDPAEKERLRRMAQAGQGHSEYGPMGKEVRFLTLLATGQSVQSAAKSAGISEEVAYKYSVDTHFREGILDATMQMRAMLYKDMPDMLALSKKTLMDTMLSPTARHEVKVKAAAHTISLAIFLATSDPGFKPPPPSEDDWALIEGGSAVEE